MTQAVIYARFSPRPDASECDSVERQLERCRSYCQAHGYEVIAEKHDEDMSGGRADNRPGLQAAISLACKRKAVLVVYKLDRLARNTRDALDVLERLQRSKADLASLVEQINTRSPMGRFFFTQLAAFAELEREQIRARTSAAMRGYQANGRRMTRADRCPFGKMPDPLDPSRLIDCPEEQAGLARMRQLRAEGRGAKAITAALNAERFPCRGCGWHLTTERRLLERETIGLSTG
jgi:DNA invertase Pin-like site-specific DNA recombinase